jgi:NAD(P)H-hydrate repair Nnr-like enzyme with NAD(P)H-hydrate dehydratase domain
MNARSPSRVYENTPEVWKSLFPFPQADSRKYSRSTALIRGGAVMTGATRLAARAAQRIGAGKRNRSSLRHGARVADIGRQ